MQCNRGKHGATYLYSQLILFYVSTLPVKLKKFNATFLAAEMLLSLKTYCYYNLADFRVSLRVDPNTSELRTQDI